MGNEVGSAVTNGFYSSFITGSLNMSTVRVRSRATCQLVCTGVEISTASQVSLLVHFVQKRTTYSQYRFRQSWRLQKASRAYVGASGAVLTPHYSSSESISVSGPEHPVCGAGACKVTNATSGLDHRLM